MKKNSYECAVCKKPFVRADLLSAHLVREPIYRLIRIDNPDWSDESYICRSDLSAYRSKYVHTLLESEKGELSELENEVLESLQKQELISAVPDREFERDWTFGERLADRIAVFGGSWPFLIIFSLFVILWIAANSWHPVDPYPFILLNLLLSCLAAIQAPIIMMSQNRQEARDRMRAEHDYQVNLKAELEIRQLNEKMDHLIMRQWQRLLEIQEIQLELLSELGRKG